MSPTLRITLMALLAAWSALLQWLPNFPHSYLFKFTGFPIILSGFLLGPKGGFWCGAVADLVGFLLKPGGLFFPGFTLTSALTGAMPSWLHRRGLSIFWAICLSQLSLKLLLGVPMRSWLFGIPWQALALRTSLEQLLHAPLYAWLIQVLLQRLERSGILGELYQQPSRNSNNLTNPGFSLSSKA